MGSITLSELAEQYRLCEAKLKRFEYVGTKELETVFTPPVSFATADKEGLKLNDKNENRKDQKVRCPCGMRNHSIKEFFLLNVDLQPESWTDRRQIYAKKKFYAIIKDTNKRMQIDKDLGHKIPPELLENPAEQKTSALSISDNTNFHDE